SFIRTVAFNWPTDAFAYKMRQQQLLLLGGLLAGLLLLRLLFCLLPRQRYFCFLTLATFGFGYMAMVFYWWGLNTIPESRRYALEFEMFFLLALCELLRLLWRLHPAFSLPVAAALGWALWPAVVDAGRYVVHSRDLRPLPKESSVEYQLAHWLEEQRPTGRVFATGGLRFRLNSWFDIQQVGGTFETGLGNRMPVHLAYQIRTGIGSRPEGEGHDAVLQLRALGVEYLVMHGPKSKEHWRDFKNWRKFDGLLEKVYTTGEQADAVYRLPFVSLAHLVEAAELPMHPPLHGYWRFLQPYVAALDDTSRPKLKAVWHGSSQLEIEGPIPNGMLMSVQVNHDAGWQATQDGRRIPIEPDQLGFMLLRPQPASQARIELRYRGTWEQRFMAILSAMVWLGALAGLVLRHRATLKSGGTAPPDPRTAQDRGL
ncbi:MAG: hypothetical protein AAB225_18510, partial [Acidobacteriota bacterium]